MYAYLQDVPSWAIYSLVEKGIKLYGVKTSNPAEQTFGLLLEERFQTGITFLNGVLGKHFASLAKQHMAISESSKKNKKSQLTPAGEEYMADLSHEYANNGLTKYNSECTNPSSLVYTVTTISESNKQCYEVVNLKEGSCTCSFPAQMELPCVHQYSVLTENFGVQWRTKLGVGDNVPSVDAIFGKPWLRANWEELYIGELYVLLV